MSDEYVSYVYHQSSPPPASLPLYPHGNYLVFSLTPNNPYSSHKTESLPQSSRPPAVSSTRFLPSHRSSAPATLHKPPWFTLTSHTLTTSSTIFATLSHPSPSLSSFSNPFLLHLLLLFNHFLLFLTSPSLLPSPPPHSHQPFPTHTHVPPRTLTPCQLSTLLLPVPSRLPKLPPLASPLNSTQLRTHRVFREHIDHGASYGTGE